MARVRDAQPADRRPEWCDCDDPSDDPRYFNVDPDSGPSCDCGVESEHLHCENCGGVSQWG